MTAAAAHGARHESHDDETTPLLDVARPSHRPRSSLAIAIIILVIVILLQTGDQLHDSPSTRLIESVSCYRYYQQHDPSQLLTDANHAGPGAILGVPEASCKVNAVQAEVAKIRTYQLSFDGLPALLLAIPFGSLHDRYGRKPFVIVGMLSLTLRMLWIVVVLWSWQSFSDLRWTWVSSLHALMMGGSPVVTTLFFTMVADISTEETRATNFLRLGACSLLTLLFAPLAAAWMMSFNPWLPMFLGLFCTFAACIASIIIPETFGYGHLADQAQPLTEADPAADEIDAAWQPSLVLKQTFRFLWQDYRVLLCIAPFAIHMLASATTSLLVQYASKRFGYTVAEATVIVTIRSGMVFLVLLGGLPLISKMLVIKFGFSAQYKDLFLTRISLVIMALGALLSGVAPTSWLFVVSLTISALGTGAMFTLRSFLTSLVPADQIAKTYSIICIIDTLGLIVGAPIMAKCFERGMALGGFSIGLAFYVFGAVSLSFALLMMFVRLRKHEQSIDANE